MFSVKQHKDNMIIYKEYRLVVCEYSLQFHRMNHNETNCIITTFAYKETYEW